MKYKVHRFNIHMEDDQMKLEQFLNSLKGEIVAVIPNNSNVSLAQIYGVSRKIDFLLIIERISSWSKTPSYEIQSPSFQHQDAEW